jgi:hypothetical protein
MLNYSNRKIIFGIAKATLCDSHSFAPAPTHVQFLPNPIVVAPTSMIPTVVAIAVGLIYSKMLFVAVVVTFSLLPLNQFCFTIEG